MKDFFFFTLLSLFFTQGQSQFQWNLTSISDQNGPLISNEISDYTLVQLNTAVMHKQLMRSRFEDVISLLVDGQERWSFQLHAADIIDPEAVLSLRTPRGSQSSNLDHIGTYQGYLSTVSTSDVRVTSTPDFFKLAIQSAQGLYYLEPAWRIDPDLPRDVYVLYDASNAIAPKESKCGVDHKHDPLHPGHGSVNKHRSSTGGCLTNEIAILTDYNYYVQEGAEVGLVSAMIVSLVNDIQQEYSYDQGGSNFDDGVEFEIVEIVISTCASCDDLSSSSSIEAILDEFTLWGSTGFSETHDLGVFWSGRDFDGTTIGLAWLTAICSPFRYNVCENFSSSSTFLRVLFAHEIGHNFGAFHDAEGSPYIMAPFVQNTSIWSTATQSSVNSNLPSFTCLDPCGAAPCSAITGIVIDNISASGFDISFDSSSEGSYVISVIDKQDNSVIYNQTTTSTSQTINPTGWTLCKDYGVRVENNCGGSTSAPTEAVLLANVNGCPVAGTERRYAFINAPTVNFLGSGSIGASSYSWDFGDGSTSTAMNPSHTYASEGLYSVTLEVNGNGIKDSLTVKILPDITPPYLTSDGGSFEFNEWHFAEDSESGSVLWERGIGSNDLSSSSIVWKTDLDADITSEANKHYLVTPEFDLSASGQYNLSFDLAMETFFCDGPGALRVEYSTDLGNTWNLLGSCSDNDLAGVSNWYNKGAISSSSSCSSCEMFSGVFADSSGWIFNTGGTVAALYPLDDLQGESSVAFRFVYGITNLFLSGYNIDGVLLDNFELRFESDNSPCGGSVLNLTTSDYPGTFYADQEINAGGTHSQGSVILNSLGTVNLLPGFEVILGSILQTTNDPCPQ